MKRKTSALLLSAVMTLGVTPYAFAGDITTNEQVVAVSNSQDVSLRYTSTDGTVSYVLYTDGSLVISGTGVIDANTASILVTNRGKITSVTIESGIRGIAKCAFYNCTKVSSVSIPDTVMDIGKEAFWGCSNLKSVKLPAGLTAIPEAVFSECENLESIEIQEGVTTIGEQAFNGCKKLSSVTMPTSVTKICGWAFGEAYPENLVIQYAGTKKEWNAIEIDTKCNYWWYDDDTTAQVIYNGQEECNHSYTYDLVDSVKWSDDYKSAKVEFVCQTCGDKQIVDADVTTKTMAPTCTDQGVTTATAKAVLKDENGKTLQTANISKVAAETPALGHEYEAKFDWAEDGSSAKATISCKRGDDEKTVDAVVTKDEENSVAATCDKAGKNVYVATVEGYDFTDTKEVEVPDQGGHKYKSEVKWSDDYKSAKVEFVCQTCGDKQIVDADVTTKTMAPTCTDQGVTTATAKAVLKDENGKTLQSATTSVVTAVTPALGHAWSEEGTVTKNATCAEEGERTYACTHEGCDEAKTESIGKLTPAVDAQRATDLSIWDRICNRKKITVTSSIVNYEYAAVENGQVGDITARGIVYAATEDLGSDELVIGANGSEAFAVPSGYTEDTYDWDITVKSKSTQYTVRSWVQYTDSNGEFAYAFSDPITVSYNGL